MILLSIDGETWHEPTLAQFQEIVADESKHCWVDIGDNTIVSMASYRKILKAPPAPVDAQGRATELYGIPVVYENTAVAKARRKC